MTVGYKGNKLFYTVNGTGPACILLHGFLENTTIWDELTAQLKNDYKIICIDLPGHGKSDVLGGKTCIADMAAAVFQVIEKEGLDKVDLVGHSMGGYVALAFAEANLERTNGILLLNSTPVADTAQRLANRKHGVAVAKKNYKAIVTMSIANLFPAENREKLEQKIAKLKKEALKTPLEGYIEAQKAMMNRPDRSTFWKEAQVKKAMILGENDPIIDVFETKKAFFNEIPEIAVLSGGHVSILENPTETLNYIRDFLNANQ